MHLNPAEYVIHILGGVRPAARSIGRNPGAISRWRTATRYGCIGSVPSSAHRKILALARARRLDITPNDLSYGRRIPNFKKA